MTEPSHYHLRPEGDASRWVRVANVDCKIHVHTVTALHCMVCGLSPTFGQVDSSHIREDGWFEYTWNCCSLIWSGAMKVSLLAEWVDSQYMAYYPINERLQAGDIGREQMPAIENIEKPEDNQ